MRKFWEKDRLYTIARCYADATIRGCFSRLTIEGRENIPTDGCILFAPNHTNALMDALLILAAYPKDVAFGARADIFRKPIAAAGLNFCRIVPLARQRDGRQAVADNVNTFSDIVECLDHNVPFTIFPEGTHRPHHTLLPIKKGLARLALMTIRQTGKQVWIVPVGIEYGEFFRFMDTAHLKFGKAIDANAFLNGEDSDPVILRKISDTYAESVCKLFTYFPADENYEAAVAEWKASLKPSLATKVARRIGGVLFFPITVAATVLGAPMLIPSELIVCRMKDKSWANTARFCINLFLRPIVALIAFAIVWACTNILWALAAFVAVMKSPNVFHWGINLFR